MQAKMAKVNKNYGKLKKQLGAYIRDFKGINFIVNQLYHNSFLEQSWANEDSNNN